MPKLKTPKEKRPEGRPRTVLDYVLLDNLCKIQCTGEEIAAVMGIDYDTLNRTIKRDRQISFADYFDIKRKNGKASLRRNQWKLAESGNATMLIWLGKQYLDQRDKNEVEVNATVKNPFEGLSDDELRRLIAEE